MVLSPRPRTSGRSTPTSGPALAPIALAAFGEPADVAALIRLGRLEHLHRDGAPAVLVELRRPEVRLIPEEQRRELVEASPPGLPLVSRVRRLIVAVLDAQLFKHLMVGLGGGSARSLLAAVADE